MPSRQIIQRRRLGALLAIGALAWVGGAALGAGSDDRSPRAPAREDGGAGAGAGAGAQGGSGNADASVRAGAAPSAAALRRLAGRTIVMRFAGTTAPRHVLSALREKRVAGVILFRDNVVGAAQVRRLTASLQRAAGGRALLMIDQEGGEIRILGFAPPVVAPPSLNTVAKARANGRAAADTLKRHGFNVNLAPVADIADISGSFMESRAFPGGPASVAKLVAANVRAYDGTGILPTVKHFPGLGRSTNNTDFRLATVRGRGEPEGFQAAIDAGAPLVMSSHALYPDLDPARIASQSKRILTSLLRDRMKFRGVVVTDSLEAHAVVQRTSTPVAATRSMAAGNDLLLTTGPASYLRVLRALVSKAQRDPAFRARLRKAEARVSKLPR